jgi:uncharacterized protein with NAD-binding domain and iron-sulfur cluster
MEDKREHVVILGGGVGGCVAAYWLTATEELRKKYRVTLYQMGWRLGGKGASSRCPEKQWRSEEHGPHVWFGFYENAFRTLRDCMKEHQRLGMKIGDRVDMRGLFEESREGVFYHKVDEGNWVPWRLDLEKYPSEPGDGSPQPDVRETLWRVADHMGENIRDAGVFGPVKKRIFSWIGKKLHEQFPAKCPDHARCGTNPENPVEFASYLSRRLVELAGSERVWYGEAVIGRALKWFLDYLGWEIHRMARRSDLDTDTKRELCLADLYRTCLRGALVDILIRDLEFKDLDKEEYLAWLKRHGAAYHKIEDSAFLRGYYDTPFAYAGGKAGDPLAANFAAGAALRGFFRIFFGYKGNYLYKMRLGMGECVFIPLYRVLKERGVKFEFFHRVTDLLPNALGNRIERIEFQRQAELAAGVSEYDPLIDAPSRNGEWTWPVWPDKPKRDLLDKASLPGAGDPGMESAWSAHPGTKVAINDRKSGQAEGETFDRVILAIPPGAHRLIAGKLMEGYGRFRRMVETTSTIRTMAFQVWVSGAENGLGWQQGDIFKEAELAGASPDPMNIILESTPILGTEMSVGARYLLYLCAPVCDDPEEPAPGTDPGYPARQLAWAKKKCIEGLEKYACLWPGICLGDGRTLDFDQLLDPTGTSGSGRMDWQYFRINIDPSERYVLTTNASAPNRLAPWDTGFNNLVFAGDWCRNAIDIGCVESAATSGMLAAHEVTGYPAMEDIAGQEYR